MSIKGSQRVPNPSLSFSLNDFFAPINLRRQIYDLMVPPSERGARQKILEDLNNALTDALYGKRPNRATDTIDLT